MDDHPLPAGRRLRHSALTAPKRRFRSRTLFLCTNLLFLAGLVIDALAPTFPLLLLGRAIQGLGTSIALPLMFNINLQQVPAKRIGTMIGVGTLITAIGPAVGPTFGGLVATTIGGRLVVLPGAAIGAVLAPLSGRLYDQLGPRIPIISGSLVALIGLLGFALTARRLTAMAILILYIFFMLGIGLSFGNIMTNGLHRLSQEQQADGNAIFNTVQQFAAAIGSSLAATIVAAGQAAVADQHLGTINGSQHALILLLIVGALEVLLVLAALGRSHKSQLA